MSKVKFEADKQKKMKGVSKAIYIIARISKIMMVVVMPFIVLLLVAIPLILVKVDVKDDSILYNNKVIVEIIEEEDGISIKHDDQVTKVEADADKIVEFKELLNSYSKVAVISYLETTFVVIGATVVIMFIVFRHLENLFINIHDEDTPFTLENVNHIKKMAYYLVAIIVLPIVVDFIFGLVFDISLDFSLSFTNIFEVLFLFSMAYIFEYGFEIQSESDAIMYGKNSKN